MSGIMMGDPAKTENLSMVEVYKLAADIGKDLESLIEHFGGDEFRDVMPKIIRCLECLEASVKKVETQTGNIRSLAGELAKSKQESDLNAKENVRLVQELEEAAEKKSEDDVFWVNQLTELQKENAFLKDQVSEKDVIAVKERVQEQEAVKVLVVMKQTVDKQRHQLRTLDAEIRLKTGDIDALQEQIERLVKLNQDLHQKNELIQTHAQGLIREKSHLMTEMRAMEKDRPLTHGTALNMSSNADTTQTEDDAPSINGKILVDPNDPNRPRFTVEELYHVLRERDELKFKLFLLEEDMNSEEEDGEQTASPQKSESAISKFFSSLFKGARKKSNPSIKEESNSGSSEGTWELLDREDSLPTVGYVVGDVKDPEKELIRILKKYQQQPGPSETPPSTAESVQMAEMHPTAGEPSPENGVGEESAQSRGQSEEDQGTGKNPPKPEGTLVGGEGTEADRRDENYNLNNNRNGGLSDVPNEGSMNGLGDAGSRSGVDSVEASESASQINERGAAMGGSSSEMNGGVGGREAGGNDGGDGAGVDGAKVESCSQSSGQAVSQPEAGGSGAGETRGDDEGGLVGGAEECVGEKWTV